MKSPTVSVFLPVVFLLHWLLPNIKIKNVLLILASLLFYAYGEPVYVLLMIGSVFMNYLLGLMCGNSKEQNRCETNQNHKNNAKLDRSSKAEPKCVTVEKSVADRVALKKAGLLLAVIWNLGLLIIFKYAGFLAGAVNAAGLVQLPVPQIDLPIGISFFTFQALSYVIDVYRQSVKPQRNFFKVLLYISFFPQLIAGPIVKYHDMEREIDERQVTLEGTARGMRRFVAGLSKKVLLSNVLGLTVDTLFAADTGSINILTAWIAAVSYLLQIYFDFSGYSDMALGMGEMFGFHFRENFNYPYVSGSIREFWRRWHMSLSGWFREYLYIPLGGNRKGRVRTVVNKFIVFFCTGLWHGASSTFVVWGLYHGAFLMLEEYLPVRQTRSRVAAVLKHIYVLLVVTVGFVIFRGDTMAQGCFFIKEMFTGFHFEPAAVSLALQQLTPLYLVVLAAAVVVCCPVKEWLRGKQIYESLAWLGSVAGLVLCMLSLSGSTYNPFIYFRF